MECLHISNLVEQADNFSSPDIVPVYYKYNPTSHYVSISNSDRNETLDYFDTVYNGISETQFDFGKGEGGYLLYFGRIHPHKGAFEVIRIAQHSRMQLVICGLIQDQEYFNEKVSPWIDEDTIIYKGNNHHSP